MDTKSSIKVRDSEIQINTQLLFQRIVTAGTRTDELPEVFKHELCPYPSALFKNSSTMLGADKASSAEGLWSPEIDSSIRPEDTAVYVFDGGA